MADLLCQDLVRGWRTWQPANDRSSNARPERDSRINRRAQQRQGRPLSRTRRAGGRKSEGLRLDIDSVRAAAQDTLEQEIESNLDSFLQNLVSESLKASVIPYRARTNRSGD